jgi:hypothetical protein
MRWPIMLDGWRHCLTGITDLTGFTLTSADPDRAEPFHFTAYQLKLPG